MRCFDDKMIEKAKTAKSAEELQILAKENGYELTEEQAKAYYEHFNVKEGELSDDELDNVSGGSCYASDGRMITTLLNDCDGKHFVCKVCGSSELVLQQNFDAYYYTCVNCNLLPICDYCALCSYEGGIWYCNSPAMRK